MKAIRNFDLFLFERQTSSMVIYKYRIRVRKYHSKITLPILSISSFLMKMEPQAVLQDVNDD